MAGGPEVLEYFLQCQICSNTFTDPVSLRCNHSFCKVCLSEFWDQDKKRKCPVCQMPAARGEPKVNTTLKGLADVFAGRIQENSDQESTPDLSCRRHKRGRNAPIPDLNTMWISRTADDQLVCEQCVGIEKHAGHTIVLLKNAVEDMKKEVLQELAPMKRQAKDCKDMEDTYVKMEKLLNVQEQLVEKKIDQEFEEIHEFLRKEEAARLAIVREEGERKRKSIERELKIIRGQIHVLTKSTCHVVLDLKHDTAKFYKDHKRIMAKAKCRFKEPHMVADVLMDMPRHMGNLKSKVMESMMTKLVKYYPVLLDPHTADAWLSVSDDFKSVREVKIKQKVPDNPERFTKYMVLGSEGYTSGKHCWDVDVSGRKKCCLGVADESVERKEEASIETRFGFWTICVDESKCTAGGADIELEKRPDKVRVQLDYEKGELIFYNAEDMSYIHAYRTTFTEKVYPFFSTEAEEGRSGINICPMKLSLIGVPDEIEETVDDDVEETAEADVEETADADVEETTNADKETADANVEDTDESLKGQDQVETESSPIQEQVLEEASPSQEQVR